MRSLFIIGNGFDLSHGLDTSYENFHKYLNIMYPNVRTNAYESGFASYANDQKFPLANNENVGFIEQVLSEAEGGKWSDLEYAMGHIHFRNSILNYYDGLNTEEWEMYFYGENVIFLMYPILQIPIYFSEWIATIDVQKATPKKDFIKLINKENDFFLSFNYTKTLEHIYGIENICHIHGAYENHGAEEELIFGHGNDYNHNSDYMDYRGVEVFFEEMHERLRKDTDKALKKHGAFFNTLSPSISKIFSYGFSFSEVDEVYIYEICKQLCTKKVIWYLNDYDDIDTRLIFRNIITKCGFNGSFDTYSIKE